MAHLKVDLPRDLVFSTLSDSATGHRRTTLTADAHYTIRTYPPEHPDKRFGPPFGISIDGTWFGEPTSGLGSRKALDSSSTMPQSTPTTSSAPKSTTRTMTTHNSDSSSLSSLPPSSLSRTITSTPSLPTTAVAAAPHATHSEIKIIAPVCAVVLALILGSVLIWLFVRRRRALAAQRAEASVHPFSSNRSGHSHHDHGNSKFRTTSLQSRSTIAPTPRQQQLENQLITVRHQLETLEATIRPPGMRTFHGSSAERFPDLPPNLDRPPDYVLATSQVHPSRVVQHPIPHSRQT